MSSSTSQETVDTKRGFSKQEVQAFRLMGNRLSLNSAQSGEVNRKAPTQKSRETIVTREKGMLGGESTVGKETVGFMGALSDITSEELDKIIQNFEARESFILQRKRAPGVKQLMAERR